MENINREHPEYVARKAMWKQYKDFYAGGEQFRLSASDYLLGRHKEPAQVYRERLDRVFYQNYIGSIVDWYAATLMRREPALVFDGGAPASRDFYSVLYEDCDLKGTGLPEFFRQRFIQAVVCGSSYIAVDFPKAAIEPRTRAEEDATGRSRAYLVDYSPDEVINWSYNPAGGLDWIVLRTTNLHQSDIADPQWEKETRWIYYDRENFKIFRRPSESKPIELIDQGRHALASLGRVPVFCCKVSEGLWLMNKAALLQLEHFNKSNALAWALTMGLFAMPVIYSDREFSQTVGESYYIQMGKDDRFGWSEPEGKVYQIAADNLVQLKDEIYRVCYLLSQAGGVEGGAQQSALAKQMDFRATEEVLRAYGDTLRDCMRQILWSIAAARQDGVTIDVAGMDEFDIDALSTELDDARKLLELGVNSPTLQKQIHKRLALKYLADARQDIKNKVAQEIEQT